MVVCESGMRDLIIYFLTADCSGRSEIEFSLTTPPPGRSEGPGPLRRKQKRVLFSAVTRRRILAAMIAQAAVN